MTLDFFHVTYRTTKHLFLRLLIRLLPFICKGKVRFSIYFSCLTTEESSPLESEDEDVGVTESQEDSERASRRDASPSVAENTKNNGRSEDELACMYHQFFEEMKCFKVRFILTIKCTMAVCSRYFFFTYEQGVAFSVMTPSVV